LYDRDTGLVRFGHRDYDPDIGRWTVKDPILFAGRDTDLYGYVLNNPVNLIDHNGLWAFDLGFTGGTGNVSINIGIKIGSSGVFAYYGFGLGGGGGISATISPTATPYSGVSVSGIARGGTGTWGAAGSVGVDAESGNVSPDISLGWGIGMGFSVGATHTIGYSLDRGPTVQTFPVPQDTTRTDNPCN
jgi:RHS repeat-associated protein